MTADLTGYKEFYAGQQRKGVPRRCRVIQRIAVNSYTSKLQSRILRNIKLFTVRISFQDKRFRNLIELLRTRQMHFVADSALLRCVLVLQMCFGIAYQNTSVRICVLGLPTTTHLFEFVFWYFLPFDSSQTIKLLSNPGVRMQTRSVSNIPQALLLKFTIVFANRHPPSACKKSESALIVCTTNYQR